MSASFVISENKTFDFLIAQYRTER